MKNKCSMPIGKLFYTEARIGYKNRKYRVPVLLEPATVENKILYPNGVQNRIALLALLSLLRKNDAFFFKMLKR